MVWANLPKWAENKWSIPCNIYGSGVRSPYILSFVFFTMCCYLLPMSLVSSAIRPAKVINLIHPPSNIRVTLGKLFFRYNWGDPISFHTNCISDVNSLQNGNSYWYKMACPTLRLYNLVAKMPDREHIGFSRSEFRWIQFGASRLFWFLAIFTPLQFGQAGLFLTSLTLVFLTKCVSTERFTQP